MRPRTARVLFAALLAAVPSTAFAAFSPAPPPTRVAVVTDTLHGVPIADPYRWLEAKDAPETRTIPTVRGKRLFFTTRNADQQQPVLAMRESSDGPDQVLVDPNPMSPDHSTSVTLITTSIDGKMLVYGIRKGG